MPGIAGIPVRVAPAAPNTTGLIWTHEGGKGITGRMTASRVLGHWVLGTYAFMFETSSKVQGMTREEQDVPKAMTRDVVAWPREAGPQGPPPAPPRCQPHGPHRR